MLEIEKLNAGYHGVPVVSDIDLRVDKGEIVALIGSNGAGKSTILRTISGLLKPASGGIFLDGKRIDTLPGHEIVGLGVAHLPEGRKLFGKLSVEDNLLLGAYSVKSPNVIQDRMERVFSLFPVLSHRRGQRAETMSGGEQQMLAIGRALMSGPQILMLDEPSLGLMPKFVLTVYEAIRQMNASGMSVLLVEQNVQKALELSNRVYVLQTGKIVFSGSAAQCADNELIRKAYLGM
jgi:branched-chain amino acid transport system ATP-binding protein